jgi:hypothetical protein
MQTNSCSNFDCRQPPHVTTELKDDSLTSLLTPLTLSLQVKRLEPGIDTCKEACVAVL